MNIREELKKEKETPRMEIAVWEYGKKVHKEKGSRESVIKNLSKYFQVK